VSCPNYTYEVCHVNKVSFIMSKKAVNETFGTSEVVSTPVENRYLTDML